MCNFGQEWESGEIETHTQYKAFTTDTIEAHVGIKIGLRNVNITLKGLNQVLQTSFRSFPLGCVTGCNFMSYVEIYGYKVAS